MKNNMHPLPCASVCHPHSGCIAPPLLHSRHYCCQAPLFAICTPVAPIKRHYHYQGTSHCHYHFCCREPQEKKAPPLPLALPLLHYLHYRSRKFQSTRVKVKKKKETKRIRSDRDPSIQPLHKKIATHIIHLSALFS